MRPAGGTETPAARRRRLNELGDRLLGGTIVPRRKGIRLSLYVGAQVSATLRPVHERPKVGEIFMSHASVQSEQPIFTQQAH